MIKYILAFFQKMLSILTKVWQVFICTIKEFQEDEGMIAANGLAFKTIFALIPGTAVFVGISSVFPNFSDYKGRIGRLVMEYLLPDVSDDLLKILDSFVSSAGTIGLVGIVGLIYISLNMFIVIDNQVNRIWAIRSKRSYLQKVLIYWALLCVLPFLLGGYFYYSGILNTMLSPLFPKFDKVYFLIVSFILLEIFFFLIYYAIPNIRVHFKKAALVATISSLFWMFLRGIFSYYTRIAIGNWVIYGSVAAIVFAFIWIYLNWIVLLFGVEFIKVWQERIYDSTPLVKGFFLYDLGMFVYFLKLLEDDFKSRGKGVTIEELSNKLNSSQRELQEIFSFFEDNKIILGDSGTPQRFYLCHDVSTISLDEIEKLLWKKMQFFSRATQQNATKICEKLGKYYFIHDHRKITVGDILYDKTEKF